MMDTNKFLDIKIREKLNRKVIFLISITIFTVLIATGISFLPYVFNLNCIKISLFITLIVLSIFIIIILFKKLLGIETELFYLLNKRKNYG